MTRPVPVGVTPNAQTVWEARLTRPDETIAQAWDRVATALFPGDARKRDALIAAMAERRFFPNSPALRNLGDPDMPGLPHACFTYPIHDSMQGIYKTLTDAAMTYKAGGGTGFEFSALRPAGSGVHSTKGVASGPCTFLDLYDASSAVVKQGGQRRAANMATFSVYHPDIEEFIDAKRDRARWQNFNVSVMTDGAFWRAVDLGYDLCLTWPMTEGMIHDGSGPCVNDSREIHRHISARKLFDRIVQNAWENGEPGMLFMDRINARNPHPELYQLRTTNPCWTGETRVWTIDGPRTFRELAERGRDVEVLSQDEQGELCFRIMRRPHMTAPAAAILRLTLDDGTVLRLTPNHHLYLKDGRKVMAKDVTPGMRLASVYRYAANQKGYQRLTNGTHMPLEHRLVGAHIAGRPLLDTEHVHHRNGDKRDNRPQNLEVLSGSVHNSQHMSGTQNPMYGVWDERNPLWGRAVAGDENPRYRHDITDDQIATLRARGLSTRAIARQLGCSQYTVSKRLGYARPVNHRVVAVEKEHGQEAVYNGMVEGTHRYFVLCGEHDAILSANCGEQAMGPYESCVLGSFNLGEYVTRDSLDFTRLEQDIDLYVEALDRMIDVARYPIPEVKDATFRTRRVGLGPMGYADMLIKLGLRYGSDDAIAATAAIGQLLRRFAHAASQRLGHQHGPYPAWHHGAGSLRRNMMVTCVAPTGTLSILADCSGGIEPLFETRIKRQHRLDKTDALKPTVMFEVPSSVRWCLERYGDRLPDWVVTAHDVTPEQHVRTQAVWQKSFVDNGASKTINLPNSSMPQDVANAYRMAYDTGCVGITVYRDGSREFQVLSKCGEEGCSIDVGREPISIGEAAG